MAMVVAEELGVPLDRIQVENADTGTTQYSRRQRRQQDRVRRIRPPYASAALEVKARLLEMAAEQLKVPVSDLVFKDGAILAQGGAKKLAIADLWQLRTQQMVVGVGRRRPRSHRQGRPSLRHALRRSGSEHAHRRDAGGAHAGRAGQRPGDEPADLSQPGLGGVLMGVGLRHDRAPHHGFARPARW